MRHTAMRGFPVIAFLGAAATLVVALLFVVVLPVAASDDPPHVDYITVVLTAVTLDDKRATNYRVTWNDTQDCSEVYNAYMRTIGTIRHLGSGSTEISYSFKNSHLHDALGLWFYVLCGEIHDDPRLQGRVVSLIGVPEGFMLGTYTSEPALTYLGVNVGNLAPSFHKNRFAYVVQEVPDETEQVTVTATARAGNAIKFVDGH